MLECVINISEGRRPDVIATIAGAAGVDLLDCHTDPHHHRSVLTLAGTDAARAVATATVTTLDLAAHDGVHPRIGVLDVVPFVPLAGSGLDEAVAARDDFSRWLATTHAVPCFRYGPNRTLPEVRRTAFAGLEPDDGPDRPHPTAGACAVGARPVLVAYNVWLDRPDHLAARSIAASVRGPHVRALGLDVGGRAQVSMNLIDPEMLGPAGAYDLVSATAAPHGVTVAGAELVGLLPAAVLDGIDPGRWPELDLGADRTIEHRLELRRTAG